EDLEFTITGVDNYRLYVRFKGVDARLSIRCSDTDFSKRSLKYLRYNLNREHDLIKYQIYSYMTGIVTGICRYDWTNINLFGQTICQLPKSHVGTSDVRKALIGRVFKLGVFLFSLRIYKITM